MLVKRKQRSIVVDIFGVEDCHRTIVQDQLALFMPNGNDSVPRLALLILHNDEVRIVGSNSQFPKYNIFHDCVVLAVAGSAAQRLQGRSPEVGTIALGACGAADRVCLIGECCTHDSRCARRSRYSPPPPTKGRRLNRQELLSDLKGGGGGLGVRLRRRRHLKK